MQHSLVHSLTFSLVTGYAASQDNTHVSLDDDGSTMGDTTEAASRQGEENSGQDQDDQTPQANDINSGIPSLPLQESEDGDDHSSAMVEEDESLQGLFMEEDQDAEATPSAPSSSSSQQNHVSKEPPSSPRTNDDRETHVTDERQIQEPEEDDILQPIETPSRVKTVDNGIGLLHCFSKQVSNDCDLGKDCIDDISEASRTLSVLDDSDSESDASDTSPGHFDENDHRALRLRKMNDKVCCKALHNILRWGTQATRPHGMNYLEYLHQVKNIKKAYLKQIFNKTQREKMETDLSGSTFDISLLFNLIKQACEGVASPNSDEWIRNDGSDTLEQSISYLKNFRNNLMHETSGLTESEFIQNTESVRDHVEKAIRLAGEKYAIKPSKIEKLVSEIHNRITNFREMPVAHFDITNYDNQALYEERLMLLQSSGRDEIIDIYNKFCNFNPVSFITGREFSLNVGMIFTRIEVIDDQRQNADQESGESIEYEDMLSFRATTTQGCTKIKILEGPAGSGKSTLTRKMMGDWISNDNSMKGLLSFQMVLYMECRDSANCTFLDLLTSLMPKTAKKFREADLERCVLGLKLLIIVDGLDELNRCSTQLFKEILQLKQKYDITLFCTTRPEKVEDCYKMACDGKGTTHLKIIGIPASRREEFATKYHEELKRSGQSEQETRSLILYLRTNGTRLQDHLRLPLNLVLLIILWSIAPEKVNYVTTATELYFEIHKLTVEKLLGRLRWKEETESISIQKLQCNIECILLKLCKEALNGLKNDEIILSDEAVSMLRRICSHVGIPDEDTLGAFLVHKIMWTKTGLQYKINYPHKGMQEFLGALCILLNMKEKGVDIDVSRFVKSELGDLCSEVEVACRSNRVRRQTLPPITNCCPCGIMNAISKIRDRFSLAFSRVNQDQLSRTGWSPMAMRLRRNFVSTMDVLVNGSSVFSATIMDILQELHSDDPYGINYQKFKNTFVHLTGLLHLTSKSNINRPLVEELVGILQKTGVKGRDEWLDLISNVKCDDVVAEVIAEKVPSIMKDDLVIKDTRVYSYVSLFKKACPRSVRVDISTRPCSVPRLEELLRLLSNHMCEVTELEFHDEFQYPSHILDTIDWAVQDVLKDCNVVGYRGGLSQRFSPSIPPTIEKFRVGIGSPDQFVYLQDLLNSAPGIRRLVLHISNTIDCSVFTPLPGRKNVHLYFSNIDSSSCSWTCKAAKALMPPTRGFSSIMFPKCTLDVSDFKSIILELKANDVSVSTAICTSANISFEKFPELQTLAKSVLNVDFRLIPEAEVWTRW